MGSEKPLLEDGYFAFVKEDCPTCTLIEPVLAQIAALGQFINNVYDNYATTYNTVKNNEFLTVTLLFGLSCNTDKNSLCANFTSHL